MSLGVNLMAGLVELAARALGVGTASDLCDYFRLDVPEGRRRVAELVEEGGLVPVEVEGWRRKGLKVGFTNGCFDILHRGHVAYLAQARSWCDRLIVALNTDASVKRLKGEGRPVNDLDSRAVVIGGLASVDRVTSFDDPTPIALIERLRPDVLIKGSDYTREGVVGGDLVESWGGEVKLAASTEFVTSPAALPAFQATYGFQLAPAQLVQLSGGDTAATIAARAAGPRARSIGTDPTSRANQPMIGTFSTSRFITKARRGQACASAIRCPARLPLSTAET